MVEPGQELSVEVPSSAVLDFTSMNFLIGERISNQFATLSITFRGAGGDVAYIVFDKYDNSRCLSGIPDGFNGPITINFSEPVRRVSILAGAFDERCSTSLTAYDSWGNKLKTVCNDGTGLVWLSVEADGIAQVVIEGEDPAGWAIRRISRRR